MVPDPFQCKTRLYPLFCALHHSDLLCLMIMSLSRRDSVESCTIIDGHFADGIGFLSYPRVATEHHRTFKQSRTIGIVNQYSKDQKHPQWRKYYAGQDT